MPKTIIIFSSKFIIDISDNFCEKRITFFVIHFISLAKANSKMFMIESTKIETPIKRISKLIKQVKS